MYNEIRVTLTAEAQPATATMAPSDTQALARWLLGGCGVDVNGIEQLLREHREAQRAAVRNAIAAVDRESQALQERRRGLVQTLQGRTA